MVSRRLRRRRGRSRGVRWLKTDGGRLLRGVAPRTCVQVRTLSYIPPPLLPHTDFPHPAFSLLVMSNNPVRVKSGLEEYEREDNGRPSFFLTTKEIKLLSITGVSLYFCLHS